MPEEEEKEEAGSRKHGHEFHIFSLSGSVVGIELCPWRLCSVALDSSSQL